MKQFSPEQQLVIDTWGQGMAVMAGAGSGKTTTLVQKCVELIRRKPDARFAAVSFTERSAGDLREKLSSRISLAGDGSSLSGHWVMTIHGLCGAIISQWPREAGNDGDETMLSEPQAVLLWEQALEGLWFDELPEEVSCALDLLLGRESRGSLLELLARVKSLGSFGVLERLLDSTDPATRSLGVLARFVLERYARLKRRRGALDFDDLEQGARRALEHERVRAAYQRRFDLILVDEFQDTNPVQASIIRSLVKPGLSNLCVVGDPKQSIYRFRDADVSVFEEVCRQLPVRQVLTWNFRSRPGIIEFSNKVCAPAFEAASLAYEPLVPKRAAVESLHIEDAPVLRLDVAEPVELGKWLRSEMQRGVEIGDFALLMRKIRGNERWLKGLSACGIPIAVGSGGLFWEDPRVRELTAFLRWWDQPSNALSGAVFLRAPWVGVSDVSLDAWVAEDRSFVAPFFASGHPLALALAGFRGRAIRPAELLSALLINEFIEGELGPAYLGLWHRCEELSSRGLDFHSVVVELVGAMEENRRERDVPPPRGAGQLTVLTLHGSKGLEFPHVLLVDLPEKAARNPDAPLLYWDRVRGAYLAPRDEDGERDKKNPEEQVWRSEEVRKNIAECMRIFYVALTRARERVVLVYPGGSSAGEVESDDVYSKDFWRGWIDVALAQGEGAALPVLSAGFSGAGAVVVSEGASELVSGITSRADSRVAHAVSLTRARYSVTEWNALSRCPRAYEWKFVRPRVVKTEDEFPGVVADNIAISQRELGTRVHRCLELGDYDGLRVLEQEVGSDRFSAEKLIAWANASPFMQVSACDIYSELAFEIPVAGETLVGAMDRVVRLPDSKYAIVDFKVTRHATSAAKLLENYSTQIALYAWALAKLEPKSRGQTAAYLVQISASGVQEVSVPVDALYEPLDLARLGSSIVAGAAGEPRPGASCRYCEFRDECSVAACVSGFESLRRVGVWFFKYRNCN